MNYTYTQKFPGGLTCKFTLTLQGTEMDWSPARPSESWKHWEEYYQWRDWCCADYAPRSGIWYLIRLDIPWLGIRGPEPIFRDSAAAYAYASAQRDGIVRAEHEGRVVSNGPPGLRNDLLAGLEREILENAPRSAGGVA